MQYSKASHYSGITLVVFSSLCYAVMNCMLKEIGHSVPPLVMVFYRNLCLILVLLPFAFNKKANFKNFFKKDELLLNVIRGSLGFIGISFWLVGIVHMPITECVAISFTTPLFITIIAITLFKERVSKLKWLLILIGFIGAIVAVAPTPSKFNFYCILILFAALLWASSAIVMKYFVCKHQHHPVQVIIFTNFIALLLSIPSLLQTEYSLTTKQLCLILISSALSAIAQVAMANAYRKAPITLVIPFDFTRLVFSGLIAYLAFGEIISFSAALGSTVIMISVSLIAWHDQSNKRNT